MTTYHLWQNETQTGPFTLNQLRSMWSGGQVTVNTLYWQEGMAEWASLSDIEAELDPLPVPQAITPAPPAPKPKVDEIPCPYCSEGITKTSTRCKHCSGELIHCPRCNKNVAVVSKEKLVGFVRGGTNTIQKCRDCGKQLTGPRW